MARYRLGLEKQQLILAHFVDIGTDLFAMAASLSQAQSLLKTKSDVQARALQDTVDLFCKEARGRINDHFHALSSHHHASYESVSRAFTTHQLDDLLTDIVHVDE